MRHHPNFAVLVAFTIVMTGPFAPVLAADVKPESATLRFVEGSTRKVQQLIGDVDHETGKPTLSLSASRYGVEGTDLGSSFEMGTTTVVLFGDTLGGGDAYAKLLGTTPETAVLEFFTAGGTRRYARVQPDGRRMPGFEVPVAGITLGGRAYVVCKINHTMSAHTDRTILTRFDPQAGSFTILRTISQLPKGKFIKMSLVHDPKSAGNNARVFMFGTGPYRESDAFLASIPAATMETGQGTRYFAGLENGLPVWTEQEADAKPIVTNGTLGDLSVKWVESVGLWLMTYDSRKPRGIFLRYAAQPWGPWSGPQRIFEADLDGAIGRYIYRRGDSANARLAGPVIGEGKADPKQVNGGAYAPYLVQSLITRQADRLRIAYVMSTWNPYVVVLMSSEFEILGPQTR